MKNNYGFDRLSRDLLFLAVILGIVALGFFGQAVGLALCFFSTLIAALTLYRTLSPNIGRRSKELSIYTRAVGSVKSFFVTKFNWLRNFYTRHRKYKYFRCPNCKQKLRAPRKKGTIRVTCANCGTQFTKKT